MSTSSGYAGEAPAGPTSGQVLSGTQRLYREHFDVSTEPDDPGLDAAIERLLRS